MNTLKIVAMVLIVSGLLGLIYGSFSYTKDTEALKIGGIELTVKEQKTVNIPVWTGIGAIVAGAGILVYGSRKS